MKNRVLFHALALGIVALCALEVEPRHVRRLLNLDNLKALRRRLERHGLRLIRQQRGRSDVRLDRLQLDGRTIDRQDRAILDVDQRTSRNRKNLHDIVDRIATTAAVDASRRNGGKPRMQKVCGLNGYRVASRRFRPFVRINANIYSIGE